MDRHAILAGCPIRRSLDKWKQFLPTIISMLRQVPYAGLIAVAVVTAAAIRSEASPPIQLSTVGSGTGLSIGGIDDGDLSGRSVSSAGDVNGDGLDDVIIGAREGDPGGRTNAGESYVVFGKADSSLVSLSDIAAGIGGFVINGVDNAERSGFSVSGGGDINGDGLSDLIIGAPDTDGTNVGQAYIVFGKTSGSAIEMSDILAGTGGFVINGIDNFLVDEAVADAGDVNGDGLADIIIGASYADPGGITDVGQSFVVFGKADGTSVEVSDLINGIGGFVITGENESDFSGDAVSGAGDVNGDGLSDVLIGASSADPGGRNLSGRSYVVFGKADGTAVELSDITAGNGGFVLNGVNPSDNSGLSVSGAGDVNGDGYSDVIIGSFGAGDFRGKNYLVFGKSTGTAIELSDIISGIGGFVINGIDLGDSAARVSGAGDINGDGLPDLVIGAPSADPGGNMDAGEAYVVFGKASTAAISLSTVASGVGGYIMNGANVFDLAGRSVSGAGDVNGDGLMDVIVGAPLASSQKGRSYVVFRPETPPTSQPSGVPIAATYLGRARAGDGAGGNIVPVLELSDARVKIDYSDDDTGSNAGSASSESVTLTRANSGVGNLVPLSSVAAVVWEISTNRSGWDSAQLTFKYTNAEINGLLESNLKLFTSTALIGPWSEITTTVDVNRNEATAVVAGFGFFALAEDGVANPTPTPTPTVTPTPTPTPTPTAPPSIAANFGLIVRAGSERIIDSERLSATDADSSAAQLTYTVSSFPTQGNLVRGSTVLGLADDTFTQSDVDADLLKYVHTGLDANTSDVFIFSVNDQTNNMTASSVFPVNVVDDLLSESVFVVDEANVSHVDIDSGNRVVVSGETGSGPVLEFVDSLLIKDGATLLAGGSANILSIGIFTGARTVLAEPSDGKGPYPSEFGPLIRESGSSAVILYRPALALTPGLFRLDLLTGERILLSNIPFGDDLAIEANGDFLYCRTEPGLTSNEGKLYRLDSQTGVETLVSGPGEGTGQFMLGANAVDVLDDGTIILSVALTGTNAVVAVDPASGDRTLISSDLMGSGPSLSFVSQLKRLPSGDLIVADIGYNALFGVLPANGNRSILSGDNIPNPPIGEGPLFSMNVFRAWIAVGPVPETLSDMRGWERYR